MKQLLDRKKSLLTYKHGLLRASSPAGYNYVLDRFTGADGTLLTAHALETGEAWTAQQGSAKILSNAATSNLTTFPGDMLSPIIVTTELPWSDCTVEVSVTPRIGAATDPPYVFGIVGRFSDTNNFFVAGLYNGGFTFRLYIVEAGTPNYLDIANPTYTIGQPYIIRMIFNGTTITAILDGSTTLTGTLQTLNQTSKIFGIRDMWTYSSQGDSNLFDYFLAWQGNGDPPPNPIYP
jgi:hypothetical protein